MDWDCSLPSFPSWFLSATHECRTARSTGLHCKSSVLGLPVSILPSHLDECFFNSLIVGLSYCVIFWQFWFFFGFRLAVILLIFVREGEACLPTSPSWPEVPLFTFLMESFNKEKYLILLSSNSLFFLLC